MKTRLIIALLAVAGAATAVSAQNTATYQIVFTSNAPGTIGSGTNAITVPQGAEVDAVVSVLINPGLGLAPGIGWVWGIADGGFSISGAGVAGLGAWNNQTVPVPYNFLYGPATTGGAISGYNVTGAIWGTGAPWVVPPPGPPGSFPAITNPDQVWSGTFTVSPTAPLGSALTVAFADLEPTEVWVGNPPFPVGIAFQNNPGAGGSITIIPAPSGLAVLLGLGGLVALRRRGTLQEART